MGARVDVRGSLRWQRTRIAIDVDRDHSGELFVIGCDGEVAIEILDVQPLSHHLVLMVREGWEKHKFLLGRDERHWFAAAVPGDGIRDVRTAIASLRPPEADGREVIRQGEWFFVPEPTMEDKNAVILRKEPLSRGGGSKPHVCAEMMRKGGDAVMVCSRYPKGIDLSEHEKLISRNPDAQHFRWSRMVRDAEVYARGDIRHPDHKTIRLWCWHRVFMNQERFAKHAPQIAFLD